MSDVATPTVRLYIPKFGKVCPVNVADAQLFREQYGAIDEQAYLTSPAEKNDAPPPAGDTAPASTEPVVTEPVVTETPASGDETETTADGTEKPSGNPIGRRKATPAAS